MSSRIVTSTYRYKRPPRKRKAVPLTGPAIVTPRSKAASASVTRGVKPGNDNRPAEQLAAIVTAKKPRGRKAVWTDDGAETPESVKAFLARMAVVPALFAAYPVGFAVAATIVGREQPCAVARLGDVRLNRLPVLRCRDGWRSCVLAAGRSSVASCVWSYQGTRCPSFHSAALSRVVNWLGPAPQVTRQT
jgi:hypothetical protein